MARFDAEKPFVTDAPPSVELNMMKKDGKYYLHLVNFQNVHTGSRKDAYYDPIEKISPVYGIKVGLRGIKADKLVLQPEGTILDFTVKDGLLEFTVPKVHIHGIVEISQT